MEYFTFSRDKEIIKSVINNADEILFIVSFQFTDDKFIRNTIINNPKNIHVEIITLPEDSYGKEQEREKITKLYEDLENVGVVVHKCFWEVGDPTLTSTSLSGDNAEGGGNKWYSMHGKFIVSEKEVLILTANFTEANELESYLRIDDQKVVEEFINKFYYLKELFIDESKYPGSIYDIVTDDVKESIDNFYNVTNRLNILQYPPNILLDATIREGLAITPFNGKAREYLYWIIENAEEFIYLASERFFDDELVDVLIKRKKRKPLDVKIMTCPPDHIRQNRQKAEEMQITLMAAGIDISIYDDIHAKCWITDSIVGIGSINLGQMNLGISKSRGYWRSNTETFYFTENTEIIKQAKGSYEEFFRVGNNPISIISKSNRHIKNAKEMFSVYGIRCNQGAKETLSRIDISNKIKNQQHIDKIVSTSVKIAKKHGATIVSKADVLTALIIFYLTERKHDKEELFEKMHPIIMDKKEYDAILYTMKQDNLIEEQDGYIKINSDFILYVHET